MPSTSKQSNSALTKRILHAIMFSALVVVFSAIAMFGLGSQSTQAYRQPGNFLNQTFRDSTADTGNIMYGLFGNGSSITTAYTKNRSSSCMPTAMLRAPANMTGGIIPANTIYVINSGNYTLTQNINLGNCSALVAKGKVYIDAN